MKKLLTLNTLISFIYVSAIDYCGLTCVDIYGGVTENTACSCTVDKAKCGPNPQRLPPDQDIKDYIVQLHNEFRERFASGRDNFPPAANIPTLAYDDNLEHTAQCWTDRCVQGHDRCRRTEQFEQVGQNYFWSSARNCGDKQLMKSAVESWYSEVSAATLKCLQNYDGCSGHFTQIIWAGTTHVGCGRMLSSSGCTIVCNYGPAGNVLDAPAYQPGEPTCGTDTKYPHLCKGKGKAGSAVSHKLSRRALAPILLLAPYFCSIY